MLRNVRAVINLNVLGDIPRTGAFLKAAAPMFAAARRWHLAALLLSRNTGEQANLAPSTTARTQRPLYRSTSCRTPLRAL